MSVTDFLQKHKVSIGLAGTTVVLATAYGSCQFEPNLGLEEAPQGEAPQEEPPAEEEPAQAEEPAAEEPAPEEPAE